MGSAGSAGDARAINAFFSCGMLGVLGAKNNMLGFESISSFLVFIACLCHSFFTTLMYALVLHLAQEAFLNRSLVLWFQACGCAWLADMLCLMAG